MSAPDPQGTDEPKSAEERARILKAELIGRFGVQRGNELFRKAQATTISRIGHDSPVTVFDPADVDDVLRRIWETGLAGLSSSEFLKVDAFLTDTRLHHRKMLRFFRFYVHDTEYAAIDTSYQLMTRIEDRSGNPAERSKTIRSLYDRLGRLRYGRRIYNQVSVGWLDHLTYPQMKNLEIQLTQAGRAQGPEREKISQIFYRSLEPDPTKLWIKSSDDPTAVFGEIAEKMVGEPGYRPQQTFLDVFAVGQAERVRDAAVADFLASYLQFESERHDQPGRIGAGFVRIKPRPRV